jgi:hypothetical protein
MDLEFSHKYFLYKTEMLELKDISVQCVENITFIRVVSYVIEIWSVGKNHDFSVLIVL